MFEWITGVIQRLGYAGVAVLTFLEHVFPPMPSEVVIPLAGLVAARGELGIALVIATGTAGSLAGAAVWYAVARKIGERRLRAWIRRHGKWLTLGSKDVDRAQDWFRRHGKSSVFLGRMVPGVRTFVSVPAGFAGMGFATFVMYSALGTAVWTGALAYAGVVLQANFTLVSDYINVVSNIVIGALALLLVRRYVKCWREN
jgi:membrane protein DedA with SNARE-associated domain